METRKSWHWVRHPPGSNKVTGFALVHEDQLLHLSVFLQKGQTKRDTITPGWSGFRAEEEGSDRMEDKTCQIYLPN